MGGLLGYRRPGGGVGIRNHVVVLPVDDISNAACQGVAAIVSGVTSIPHPYGRLQFGRDLDLFFRTLIGTGSNPNVAGAIVVGIEPNWTHRVAGEIARTGTPVDAFSIETHGDLETIRSAARAAQKLVQDATELRREPIDWSDLVISTKCGESDTTSGLASNPAVGLVTERLVEAGGRVIFGETSETTGAEHLLEEQCATDAVRERFREVYRDYVSTIEAEVVDLLGSQPTEGNIRGGLTTIEEKGLGNVQKAGKSPIVGVLSPAESPPSTAGLYFMDSSSAAAEMVTLCAAAGAVAHLFTTGQGNVVGHPILPVTKISANPNTCATMAEHIDVDIAAVLRGDLSLEAAAGMVLEYLSRVVNGRMTCAEALKHVEFSPTRLHISA